MVRKIVVIFCLLAVSAVADVEVTSLPATLNTNGERYYLTGDLSWAGTVGGAAVTISGTGIVFDLQNNNILFGSSDNVDLVGVQMNGATSCTLKTGGVRHQPSDSSNPLYEIFAVDYRNTEDCEIRDMTLTVTGIIPSGAPRYTNNGIHCIRGGGFGVFESAIVSCSLLNQVEAYWRRDDKPACGMSAANPFDNRLLASEADYHYRFDSNYVTTPHVGVFLGYRTTIVNGSSITSGRIIGRENTFNMAARNDSAWCTTCSGGYRYGDAYAWDLTLSSSYHIVADTIISDTANSFGGGGFFLNGSGPDATDPYVNYMRPQVESCYVFSATGGQGGNHSTNFRTRNGLNTVEINDNILIAVCDTAEQGDPNTIANDDKIAAQAFNFFLGYNNSYGVDTMLIRNNACTTIRLDGGATNAATYFLNNKAPTDQWNFRNNHYVSDGYFFLVGNVYGADTVYSRADTFELGSNHDGSNFMVMDDNVDAEGYFVTDPVYSNGAAVSFTGNGANSQELIERMTMTFTVKDSNGIVVPNANVWLVNAYDTVFQTLTDVNGTARDTVYTNFFSNLATDTTLAQYNNFTFGAAISGDTATATFAVSATLNDTTLTLGTIGLAEVGRVIGNGIIIGNGEVIE